MKPDIQVIEKPDWVSWDDIRQCLYEAHAVNREKGINMTHYLWSAEKIKGSLGEDGVMLVALDGEKLVGTAAIADKNSNMWYARGRYAYICFDAVLPDYTGIGIFKELDSKREIIAKEKGFPTLVFDTHSRNTHRLIIAKKNDYRLVRFFLAKSKDHYSVVMVKWLNGCPYSKFYCWMKFHESKIKTIIRNHMKK